MRFIIIVNYWLLSTISIFFVLSELHVTRSAVVIVLMLQAATIQ